MNHKNIKVVFIPGNGGSNPTTDIWYPYAKAEFEKLGITVIAREFPDSRLARKSYWIPFLLNELGVDENTILIGHSSGAVAAMTLAQTHQILGSVLIAGCHSDLNIETERLSGYYETPWQWNAIKKKQSWIIQFASTDDPWIPIKEAQFIHEKLGTEYYEFTDQGHFCGKSYNKQTFPELIAAVKKKIFN